MSTTGPTGYQFASLLLYGSYAMHHSIGDIFSPATTHWYTNTVLTIASKQVFVAYMYSLNTYTSTDILNKNKVARDIVIVVLGLQQQGNTFLGNSGQAPKVFHLLLHSETKTYIFTQ